MFDDAEFERQLTEAREALQKARSARGDHAEPVEAYGNGAEGLIKVKLDEAGRVESFDLDPRILRAGTDYLAAELRKAVNEALGMYASGSESNEPVPDLAAMTETVQRIQDQGLRQMTQISAAIAETMRRIHRD